MYSRDLGGRPNLPISVPNSAGVTAPSRSVCFFICNVEIKCVLITSSQHPHPPILYQDKGCAYILKG